MKRILALLFLSAFCNLSYTQQSPEDCTSLINFAFKDTTITSARVVPASGSVPEYCEVSGGVETVILFEIALPTTAWNGRFFYAGGGGYNGNIPDLTHAIARGYAVQIFGLASA